MYSINERKNIISKIIVVEKFGERDNFINISETADKDVRETGDRRGPGGHSGKLSSLV